MNSTGNKNTISRKIIKFLWLSFASALIVMLIFFTGLSMGWFGFMPGFEELENPKSNLASEVISIDQVILGTYYIENRTITHYEELSPYLINALVATEDVRFIKHSGIDLRGMMRVFFKNFILRNKSAGGGSTITQQLAKNLFPRQKKQNKIKLAITKFKEWITALKLERNYTKEEIIAMYFNTVDFGNNSFGIKSAAKTYFNKTPAELNMEESALLVGMLKAPTKFSPVRHPEAAIKRREVVLNQMMKYKYITQKEYDSVKTISIDMSQFKMLDQNTGKATYFREYIRAELMEWCRNNKKQDGTSFNLYKDGLKVYTTINSRMQTYAEEAVSEYIGKELQPQFYQHWKGFKNAPFDPELTPEEYDLIIKQAIIRTGRYVSLKESGLSYNEIYKEFTKPVKMRIFTWQGEKETLISPLDSIRHYKFFLRAGLMSVEPHTGFVRAYVGGINYKHFKYDQVMFSKRQVGSTFKPFVYALAVQELRYSPCKKVPNIPVTFDMPDGSKWTPSNSDDDKEGQMVTL
ncbi:MAG: transglycosylase domain-containing protein, partial [Bacteroidales bacterium]|nr:transglycosylase domain-containing protein [Bacteroidales bacterium]